MAYGVEDLKGLLKQERGVAFANLYRVTLPSLAGAVRADGKTVEGFSTKDLNILCKATAVPGRQILTLDRQIGMTNTKVAYGYAVPEVSLTFTMTNTYAVRKYFEEWQQLAISNEPPYESGYFLDYTKNVRIAQLRKPESFQLFSTQGIDLGLPNIITENLPTVDTGILGSIDLGDAVSGGNIGIALTSAENIVYECELQNAFPTSMTDINLSDNADEVAEMSVSLSYKNWRSTNPGTSSTFTDTINDVIGEVGDVIGGIIGF